MPSEIHWTAEGPPEYDFFATNPMFDKPINYTYVYQTSKEDFDSWRTQDRFEDIIGDTVYRGTQSWVRSRNLFPYAVKESIVTDPETGGMKGQKDVRLHALPWESLAELGRVYTFGENKYDDYNFRKGYKWSLSADALDRHFKAFWNREDRDGESGLHHLAHAAWHCFTLLFFSLTGRGTDDRPV